MARYFYDHSFGENLTLDDTGCICGDDEIAVQYGHKLLADLLSSTNSKLPWRHHELVVRREDKVHVGRIGMTIVTEPQNPVTAAALPFN